MSRRDLTDRPAVCQPGGTCPATTHNTRGSYRRGCISLAAQDAIRVDKKRRREGRSAPALVDSLPAARRLRALFALGHTGDDLAADLNADPTWVRRVARGAAPKIHVKSDRAIRALYERRQGTPGGSAETRDRAKAKRWPPPLAWDNIDDPEERPKYGDASGNGRREHASPAEVLRLTASGRTAQQIATDLGITARSVSRIRSRHAAQTAA